MARPSPEHFAITGDSPYDHAFVLVNESYFGAWKARIEGILQDVVEANVRFMAIPVKKGRFDIELRFESTYLLPGLFISGVGVLACGFFLISAMTKRNSA